MSSIFFYIFIYFVGFYGSNILNMFTVRPLITNRYMAALIPVVCIALLHGYMISTTPPKSGSQDISIEMALLFNIVVPVLVVAMGAVYFMWNSKQEEDEADESDDDDEDEDDSDDAENKEKQKKASDTIAAASETSADDSKTSPNESTGENVDEGEAGKKNKDV